VDDDAFLRHVADRLGELPGVEAVTLGGSRAQGTHRPDYPMALRERAPRVWWGRAEQEFDYARMNHAPRRRFSGP